MQRNLATITETLFNYVPKDLIAPINQEKIQKILRLFPSKISDFIIFESRLAFEEAITDVALQVNSKNKELYEQISNWDKVNALFDKWNNNSVINKYMENIWLEFDIHEGLNEFLIPSIIFPEFYDNLLINDLFYKEYDIFINSILKILERKLLTEKQMINFDNCFTNLDKNIKLYTIGIPVIRESKSIRVCFFTKNEDTIYDYLKRIGLKKRISDIKRVLNKLEKFCDHFILHLDIEDSIMDKICVEFSFFNLTNIYSLKEKWQSLLEFFVENKMCITEKKDALLNWLGESREIFNPEINDSIMKRFILEVKVVFETNKQPIVKGYFGIKKIQIL
ncbi:MAG: hypothetical protein A2Y34_01155 [Spirochaetes bacterium GWC1_27_15]|nr:MAG: hypothetical protein A2Z98_00955 [Spirochaetes bacterium GWB1_27_13]OHD24057.1 MAG: hypothetical protein A2Y34_01155 [Spirochaetes bacterium GWC1_27_15]